MLHKIVVVGGGAGGLELATRLGRTLGKRQQAKQPWLMPTSPIFGNPYCMKWPQAHGSLVSLSQYSAVGNLMGGFISFA